LKSLSRSTSTGSTTDAFAARSATSHPPCTKTSTAPTGTTHNFQLKTSPSNRRLILAGRAHAVPVLGVAPSTTFQSERVQAPRIFAVDLPSRIAGRARFRFSPDRRVRRSEGPSVWGTSGDSAIEGRCSPGSGSLCAANSCQHRLRLQRVACPLHPPWFPPWVCPSMGQPIVRNLECLPGKECGCPRGADRQT
jgi:hypothetical protein